MGRLNHTGTEKGELSGEPAAEPETPKMTLSFFGNGRLETSTKMGNVIQEKQGTWKFVSFDDSTEVMNLTCVIRGQESKHQVEFIDPETIKLVPPNMAGTTLKINFKRQD